MGAFFAPTLAEAGTCGNFCKSIITREGQDGMVVSRSTGSTSCTEGSVCTLAICGSGLQVASLTEARVFCASPFRSTHTDIRSSSEEMCAQITAEGYAVPGRGTNAFCFLTQEEVTRSRISSGSADVSGPSVNSTPAPQPATPGDQFRCRFLCEGETQTRDGAVCTGVSDQNTCIRQCITACGPRMPDGGGCAGLDRSNQPDFRNQQAQPRCIAVAAASTPGPSVGGITDTGRFESLNESFSSVSVVGFIGGTIKVLIGIAGSVFFLFMVWGGIRWMMAGGDPGEVSAAKSTIQNAMIGVILLALSYTIVTAFLSIATNFVPAATRSSSVTGERPPAR